MQKIDERSLKLKPEDYFDYVEELQKSMKEDTEDIVTNEDKTIKDISINTKKRTARNI